MPWTRNNRIFSFIYWLFVNFVKYVNFNAKNEVRRIEMDPRSNNNSPVSQSRHQTWQPTPSLTAGFDGNVTNEEHQAGAEITMPPQMEILQEHQAGAEITMPPQIEIGIPEPNFQLDQSQPTQTVDQDETFKSGVNVALWATSISASGVIAVWTGFLVNQQNTPKCEFFAKASLLSMSTSFISGLFIFVLSFIRPKFEANPIIVKVLMFGAIGSTTLVVGLGVAFYFEKSA